MLSGGFPVPPGTCEHFVSIVKGIDSSLGTVLTEQPKEKDILVVYSLSLL